MTIYKKKSIPASLRREVWTKWVGKKWETQCFVSWCTNTLDALSSWEAGHDIAESKGGKTNIANLRPICSQCNKSMGTRSIREFSDTHDGYAIDFLSARYKVRHPREVDTAEILVKLKNKYETNHTNKTCTCLGFINRGRCKHLFPRKRKRLQ